MASGRQAQPGSHVTESGRDTPPGGQPEDHLLAIVGPTAAGKSALALQLARKLDGEIVSADSRQVYRYLNVGTSKPTAQERSDVPHHLVDIIDPDQDFSLSLFLSRARDAIEDIQCHGKLPILVGGTGQYVWGLLEGWRPPEVPPDPDLRRELEERAKAKGTAALYVELTSLDPEAAARTDGRNLRRVIRALEVFHSSDRTDLGPPGRIPLAYDVKVLGLTLSRPDLYQKIDTRVDNMIGCGWVGEVRGLLERGYSPELPSLSSLGYLELIGHLKDEISLDGAIERIKYRTHRLARSQYAWFRTTDQRIHWSDAIAGFDTAEAAVEQWLAAPGRADAVDRQE